MSTSRSPNSGNSPSLSHRVVENVADFRGVDPVELPPLYGVVDPDALDSLFGSTEGGSGRMNGHIEFIYAKCSVTVKANGRVLVADKDDFTNEGSENWGEQ